MQWAFGWSSTGACSGERSFFQTLSQASSVKAPVSKKDIDAFSRDSYTSPSLCSSSTTTGRKFRNSVEDLCLIVASSTKRHRHRRRHRRSRILGRSKESLSIQIYKNPRKETLGLSMQDFPKLSASDAPANVTDSGVHHRAKDYRRALQSGPAQTASKMTSVSRESIVYRIPSVKAAPIESLVVRLDLQKTSTMRPLPTKKTRSFIVILYKERRKRIQALQKALGGQLTQKQIRKQTHSFFLGSGPSAFVKRLAFAPVASVFSSCSSADRAASKGLNSFTSEKSQPSYTTRLNTIDILPLYSPVH